jgi:C4-dicarboxylate transporter DctM subunit
LLKAFATDTENRVASLALAGIMILPLAEIASRRFLGAAIPGSGAVAATLTLWLGMLGAAIAARDGKLLTLATGEFLPKGPISEIAHVLSGTVGALIATILALGGSALVQSDRIAGDHVTEGLATWVADLALPIGFALIALRLVWHASPRWYGRAIASLGIVAGILLNHNRAMLENQSLLPWFLLVIVAGILGAPIFALLGGFALFASLTRGNPPVVLPMMAYQDFSSRKDGLRNGCCVSFGHGSGGRREGRPSRRQPCAHSSRSSPADRA